MCVFNEDVVTGSEEYTNAAELDEDQWERLTAIFELLEDTVEDETDEWHVVRGSGAFELVDDIIHRDYEFTNYKLDGTCSGIDTQVRHYYEDASAYFTTGICSGYEIETQELSDEEHEEKMPWSAISEQVGVLIEDLEVTVQVFGAVNMNGRVIDKVYYGHDSHNATGYQAFFARCNELIQIQTFEHAMEIPSAVYCVLEDTIEKHSCTQLDWHKETACSELIVLAAEDKIFHTAVESTYWFDDSSRVFEVSVKQIPKRAMNSLIATNYFVQAEPQGHIMGACGVAYGWMVKKYFASATQEKEFDEEEEGHDFTYAADQNGVRQSEHAHANYHSIAKRFHGE